LLATMYLVKKQQCTC